MSNYISCYRNRCRFECYKIFFVNGFGPLQKVIIAAWRHHILGGLEALGIDLLGDTVSGCVWYLSQARARPEWRDRNCFPKTCYTVIIYI